MRAHAACWLVESAFTCAVHARPSIFHNVILPWLELVLFFFRIMSVSSAAQVARRLWITLDGGRVDDADWATLFSAHDDGYGDHGPSSWAPAVSPLLASLHAGSRRCCLAPPFFLLLATEGAATQVPRASRTVSPCRAR